MQIRPTAFTIGPIIHPSIALFCVYTEFGIDSKETPQGNDTAFDCDRSRCGGCDWCRTDDIRTQTSEKAHSEPVRYHSRDRDHLGGDDSRSRFSEHDRSEDNSNKASDNDRSFNCCNYIFRSSDCCNSTYDIGCGSHDEDSS